MRKSIIPVIVILLIVVQAASGQTVDDVIDKYIEARGGKQKLDSLTSVYIEGSGEQFGDPMQTRIIVQKGKLYREEIDWSFRTTTAILTDKDGWYAKRKHKKNWFKLNDSLVEHLQPKLDFEYGLIDYAKKGHTAELLGKDTARDGSVCYKVKFIANTGIQIIYWFSVTTHLKVQAAFIEQRGEWGDKTEGVRTVNNIVLYKDYRYVNGILFPFTEMMTMTYEDGNSAGNISTYFSKIETNIPVNPKLFEPIIIKDYKIIK